ncbi:hypothetical protein C7449_1089 [Mycoplana dimorpha]|uniref:Uncharacterized protein n=1 Tax=Mycoplana dimorpha TaxID=28320 RepID=A0A2T5AZ36_MYCDI|nr:hypothetical protein C7449_1089 [Mycoplana dimorpha]
MAAHTMRYAVRCEAGQSWTVYDVFTGDPAKPSSWNLVNLTLAEATTYCAVLNAKDLNRRNMLDI